MADGVTAPLARNEEPGGFGINGVMPGDGKCVVCHKSIATGYLMCKPHWEQVPVSLQANLSLEMRGWQWGDGTFGDLRDAQWACVEALNA